MKKALNPILFSLLLLAMFSLSVVFGFDFLSKEGPWQLQPFTPENELPKVYEDSYKILDHHPVISNFKDTSKTTVVILVDAWGVSRDGMELPKDFSYFESLKHEFTIHKRLANRTKHAEKVECRHTANESIFLFGGDSLEYDRKSYMEELGFSHDLFCHECGESIMFNKLDSLINEKFYEMIAMTVQSSRDGSVENLHGALQKIATIALKYPEVKFFVIGTHRPILGTPETRRKYCPYWVPAVILN